MYTIMCIKPTLHILLRVLNPAADPADRRGRRVRPPPLGPRRAHHRDLQGVLVLPGTVICILKPLYIH
jgi:hypothetical protein